MRTLNFLTAIALSVAALCGTAHAQPLVDKLYVQGYLQKANGQAVTDGSYHIAFGVSQNGTYIWGAESVVSVTNGLFNTALSGGGQNLTSLPAGSGINQNFTGATLIPALLMTGGSGEINVHVYTVDAIDGNTGLNFDIPLGAVPTAYVASVAQSVASGSIVLSSLATSAYTNTAAGATAGQLVALDSSGLINTNFLPTLTVSGGVAAGGTGGTSGSIQGTGSVTYQSADGSMTTLGNATGVADTVVASGTGGIQESVTGTSGDIDLTAGSATGGMMLTTGTAGSLTLASGSGGIMLAPTSGLVRVGQGGINLINGAQSITVNSPSGMSASYTLNLPSTTGAAGQFLTTDGGASTVTAYWTNTLNPTGALTVAGSNTTGLSILPAGNIAIAPTGSSTIGIGGSGSSGVTINPAGATAISPTAGGLVLNPTSSLQLGGASTTTTTMSPSGSVTIAPTGALLLGGASNSVQNGLAFVGSTSGALTISAAATTTPYSVILPNAQGGGALVNDGSGNLSWSALSTAITTVNPTGALTLGGGSTTSETIDPNGNLSVNPTGTIAIGGAGTTGITIAPSSGNAPVTIAAAGTGALTLSGSSVVASGPAKFSSTLTTTGDVGIGTASPSAWLNIAAGTATAGTSPLKLTSGTNLTTPEAGAIEYDGTNFYATGETTSGRGIIQTVQEFHLAAAETAFGPAIGNVFGTTSNITLASGGHYDIDIYIYYNKATAGTVTWTLANTAAPTSMTYNYEMSPATGIVAPPGTATMLIGQAFNTAAASVTVATASITNGANNYAHFHIMLINGTGTSLKIEATESAGTIAPGVGSYWIARRLPTSNVGTFSP